MVDMVLSIPEIILRLVLAMVMGGAIGFGATVQKSASGITDPYFSPYGGMCHCTDPSRDR